MNLEQLREMVDKLFQDRMSYMILQQEISEHFYPQRADFTVTRTLGTEFANDLMTSYPVLTRRDLGDQIGQMLRPTATPWFKMVPKGGEKTNNEGKRWLEMANIKMRNAMYTRPAQFNKATKQGDHDFATFGLEVLTCRPNKAVDNLLYRNWHPRDVAFATDEEGKMLIVARKWKPYAYELKSLFGDKAGPKVERMLQKNQHLTKVPCYHIMVRSEMYDDNSRGRPWFSLYFNCEHEHLMESVPVWVNEYIISRWQTVSGSQYPFSPATITALPDARLLQSMTYTLLEAGEKAVNPPMVATEDVIRSDMAMYAGGVTWVDKDYDEKLGDALRPITRDIRALPFGQDMLMDSRMLLAQAFFLNKLTLPERAPEMTAYEVGQRIQEYIRGALPIFEPMEDERNGQVCETTFETLFRLGVFGSPRDIPPQLFHDGIDFEYMSPLHDAIEEQKGQKFLESKALIAEALDLDRGAAYVMDARTALRDALTSVGIPPSWLHPKEAVEEMVEDAAEAESQQMQLEQMVQGSEVAKNVGQAGKQLEMV